MRLSFLLCAAAGLSWGIVPSVAERSVFDRESRAKNDARVSGDTTSSPVTLLSSGVDTTVTLGAWLKAHPADSVNQFAPVSGVDDPFCRSSVAAVKLGNRTVTRYAMFYVPEAPPGENLPADTTHVAESVCVLRTFWLSIQAPDSAKARLLADSIGGLIDARLGTHANGHDVSSSGSAGWKHGRNWQTPSSTVVLAVKEIPSASRHGSDDESEASDSAPANPARLVVFGAYAPGSGIQHWDLWEKRYNEDASRRADAAMKLYPVADSALALARLPTLTRDLGEVLTAVRRAEAKQIMDEAHRVKGKPTPPKDPPPYTTLLRALRAVHDTAPLLSPSQLAAALVAADVTLNASMRYLDSDTAAIYRSLDSLGITYEHDPLGAVWTNPRPWLWYAYRIDSTGVAGHMAFIELLGEGWSTKAMCRDGEDQYAKIIEHGEAALKRGDTDPMVHYYVGIGYKSIFDLAHVSEESEYIDPRPYRPQAEAARLQSIAHFRAALKTLRDPVVRRSAWDLAVKMMLRRPSAPSFVCVYD